MIGQTFNAPAIDWGRELTELQVDPSVGDWLRSQLQDSCVARDRNRSSTVCAVASSCSCASQRLGSLISVTSAGPHLLPDGSRTTEMDPRLFPDGRSRQVTASHGKSRHVTEMDPRLFPWGRENGS